LYVTVKSLVIMPGFSSFIWLSFIGSRDRYWDKPATIVSDVTFKRSR
jgi:hypothetical protein